MNNISIIFKKFTNKSLKNIMFATSLLFIVGCSNGKIEISDIENSIVGEYSCQFKLWALPGSELFLFNYKFGDRNLIRTPYGIAYEVNENSIYNFKGGSNFLGAVPNELLVSNLDDAGKIKRREGPYIWELINDGKGNLYFSADKSPYWKLDYSGMQVQNFTPKDKTVVTVYCRRDNKEQEKTMRLIDLYKKQFQK
jgi:hypothetical protein